MPVGGGEGEKEVSGKTCNCSHPSGYYFDNMSLHDVSYKIAQSCQ